MGVSGTVRWPPRCWARVWAKLSARRDDRRGRGREEGGRRRGERGGRGQGVSQSGGGTIAKGRERAQAARRPGARSRCCLLEAGARRVTWSEALPPGAGWRLVSGFPRVPAWATHSFPLPGAAGQEAGFRTQGAPGTVVPGCFMETFWPHSCAYGIPIFSPLLRGARSEVRISKRGRRPGPGG